MIKYFKESIVCENIVKEILVVVEEYEFSVRCDCDGNIERGIFKLSE